MTKLKWVLIWKLEEGVDLSLHYFETESNMLHISHFAVLPCSDILTILNCLRMKGCNRSSVTSKFYTNLYFWSLATYDYWIASAHIRSIRIRYYVKNSMMKPFTYHLQWPSSLLRSTSKCHRKGLMLGNISSPSFSVINIQRPQPKYFTQKAKLPQ